MNFKDSFRLLLSLSLLFGIGSAQAGEDGENELDVTITVVDEDDTPETTFEKIELPIRASSTAVEKSQKGLDTANQAGGHGIGQKAAESAKSKEAKNGVRAFSSDASNQNRENIKDLVSGHHSDPASDKIPDDVKGAIGKGKGDQQRAF